MNGAVKTSGLAERLASLPGLVGVAGVIACVGLAVWAGRYAWGHPLSHAPTAARWLAAYAVWLLAGGSLCWAGRGRWLLGLTAAALASLLLASLLGPQVGRAYAAVALVTVVAGGLGHWLLRRLTPTLALTRLEGGTLGVALGWGVVALLTLALGLLQLLRPWLLFALLAVGLVALAPALVGAARGAYHTWVPRARRAWHAPDLAWTALGVSILAAAFVGGWLWALAPAVHFDSLVYHLGVPTIYLQQQAIVEVPEEFRSYWAHNAEMLYTLALALAGQPAPGLIHLASGVLTTGLVFAAGRRLGGARTGLAAAALFYTLPVVTWLSGTTYIDLLATFYTAALVYAALAWAQDRHDGWLLVAGVMAGLGLGTKLTVALVLLPLGLVLLAAALAHRGRSHRTLLALAGFGLGALLAYAPWLARDAFWTGNPIFPYFNALFRSPDWPPTNTLFNFASFGHGRDLLAFLRLPWDLTLRTEAFMEWAPVGSLGALALLALPWCYLRPGHAPQRLLWAGAVLSLGVAALWFGIGPYLRYILPLCPVLAVLAAHNLEPLWELRHWQPRYRLGGLALVLAIVAAAGATRASHLRGLWQLPELYPYRLVLGRETTAAFLARTVGVYHAFQAINQLGQPQEKVLAVEVPFRLYSDRPIVDVSRVLTREQFWVEPGPALAQALSKAGYRHLLFFMYAVNATPTHFPPFVTDQAFLNAYAELEYDVGHYRIYRLRP